MTKILKIMRLCRMATMRYILRPHELVYRKKPSHDSFYDSGGRNDGQIKIQQPKLSEKIQRSGEAWGQVLPIVGKRLTIYSETGVGVHQGECVIFRRWALLGGTGTHPWVVDKLRYQDLEKLQHSMVQQLCCCACFLARHYKQSYSEKMDLQETIERELTKCPHGHEERLGQQLISEGIENADISAMPRLPKQWPTQEYQQGQPEIKCPFEGIIGLLDRGVNHMQTEPS